MHLEAPDLHQERLRRVVSLIKASDAQQVLDLGCGSGGLLQYLLRDLQFTRVVGLELSGELLAQAKLRLEDLPGTRAGCLELISGSYADAHPELVGFEAAAMVETIEHVPPKSLSRVERAIFAGLRPAMLVMTTPNHEYNSLYDMAPGEFRDPDHQFEWDRARFRDWATGVAHRNDYRVRFSGIGDMHDYLGQPSQVATFFLRDTASDA